MCYWAYSVILGFRENSTLSGITDEFTERWRNAQVSTPRRVRRRRAVTKPRSRRSYRGRASLVEEKCWTERKPRSRSQEPRSRQSSRDQEKLQGENRGRGRRCRGRAFVRREEKKTSRRNTAVAVDDAAVAPDWQDKYRDRGRSAAVAACAFSEISGFPSEDHIFISFLIFS